MAHYIATCPIIYLYLDTDRRPGLRTWTSLWEQEVLFLSGKPAEWGGMSPRKTFTRRTSGVERRLGAGTRGKLNRGDNVATHKP